ncbi:MAG: formylmethanofuran dehydrogenase subunit E family protein, partial [Candidatus Ranarchaeia archaeon]
INATKDEQLDLFTRVEYDWCGVDGIQFVTGCTPGNRNLRVHPWNIWRMQLVRKSTGEAVEVELDSYLDESMVKLTLIKTGLMKDKPNISEDEYNKGLAGFRGKLEELANEFIGIDFHKAASAKKTKIDWKNTR